MNWIDRQPDASGRNGHAWDLIVEQRVAAPASTDDAAVAWWVFHAQPAQHPAWCWYFVTTVHLRDNPGQTSPPFKHFPAATHELLVLACDPDYAPPLPGRMPFLTPPNVCVQFTCAQDANAITVTHDIAHALAGGVLPVEEPGGNLITSMLGRDTAEARRRSQHWRHIIDQTLEHIVTGRHS